MEYCWLSNKKITEEDNRYEMTYASRAKLSFILWRLDFLFVSYDLDGPHIHALFSLSFSLFPSISFSPCPSNVSGQGLLGYSGGGMIFYI